MYPNISDFCHDYEFMEKLSRQIINQMVYIKHYWSTMSEAEQRWFYGYIPAQIFEEVLALRSDTDGVENGNHRDTDISKDRRPD